MWVYYSFIFGVKWEREREGKGWKRRGGEGEECRDYIKTLESECLSVMSDSLQLHEL